MRREVFGCGPNEPAQLRSQKWNLLRLQLQIYALSTSNARFPDYQVHHTPGLVHRVPRADGSQDARDNTILYSRPFVHSVCTRACAALIVLPDLSTAWRVLWHGPTYIGVLGKFGVEQIVHLLLDKHAHAVAERDVVGVNLLVLQVRLVRPIHAEEERVLMAGRGRSQRR